MTEPKDAGERNRDIHEVFDDVTLLSIVMFLYILQFINTHLQTHTC